MKLPHNFARIAFAPFAFVASVLWLALAPSPVSAQPTPPASQSVTATTSTGALVSPSNFWTGNAAAIQAALGNATVSGNVTIPVGSTLTINGAATGTPTGGTLNLSNTTLTLPTNVSGGTGTLQSKITTSTALTAGSLSLALSPLGVTSGGTGLIVASLGDLIYGSGTNTRAALSGSTSATMAVLTQTGDGVNSAAPAWTATTGTGSIVRATGPTITLANATGLPVATGISGLGSGWTTTLAAATGTSGQVLASNGTSYVATTLAPSTSIFGTANQITASAATGNVTLALASPLTFPGNVTLPVTLTSAGNAAATLSGIQLANTTASNAGVPVQYSPNIQLTGRARNTTTPGDEYLEVVQELRPVSASTPTSTMAWAFRRSTNQTGAYTDALTLTSAGVLTFPITTTGAIRLGSSASINASTGGTLQFDNAGKTLYFGGNILYPATDNDMPLGVTTNRFASLYLSPTGLFVGGSGSPTATAGAVTSAHKITKNTTAISNAVATNVLTITVPNAAHSATVRVTLNASLGAGGAVGANEASASISYDVNFTRTAGVNAVGTVSTAYGSAASAVAGATTCTVTGALSAVSGAVGAANTFTFQVTISRGTGSSTNHTCFLTAEILNANASGITIQ